MNLNKFTKPTQGNLLFVGALGIFGFLFLKRQITQDIFVIASSIMTMILMMASGSKYEINKHEAETLALKEINRMQLTGDAPKGTISLATETTLNEKGDIYFVAVEISKVGKVETYIIKVTLYGTVIATGRHFGKFSAMEEVKAKLPEELKKVERQRDIGTPPEGQEKTNTGEGEK